MGRGALGTQIQIAEHEQSAELPDLLEGCHSFSVEPPESRRLPYHGHKKDEMDLKTNIDSHLQRR